MLTRTLAATVLMAVTLGGISTAKSSPFPIDYAFVDTALANGESLGSGFDITLEAAVTDFGSGGDLFAAFRFTNPTSSEPGGLTGSGSDARIHEIYFEGGLDQFISDTIVYRSDDFDTPFTAYDGVRLRPAQPPGIFPDWNNTYLWFDEGSGATGVGNGEYFEVIFALADNVSFDTAFLLDSILGNGPDLHARIAMHIGDCDGTNSCVIDTWPPPSVIPLPAALPLYGTGLAVISFVGWRKKRKAAQA